MFSFSLIVHPSAVIQKQPFFSHLTQEGLLDPKGRNMTYHIISGGVTWFYSHYYRYSADSFCNKYAETKLSQSQDYKPMGVMESSYRPRDFQMIFTLILACF